MEAVRIGEQGGERVTDNTNNDGIKGYHLSWLLILAGVVVWSFWNRGEFVRDFHSQCFGDSTMAVLSPTERDSFCTCVAEDVRDELNWMVFVPFINRLFVPGDEEMRELGAEKAEVCIARHL